VIAASASARPLPVPAVRRNGGQQDVAVWIGTATVPFILALLDADLRDETNAVEVRELGRAFCARLRAHIVRLDTACTFQDCPQAAAANLGGLGVTVGCARKDHALPELPSRVLSVDNNELGIEHFASAVLGAFQHSFFASAASAHSELHSCDGVGWDNIEFPLLRGVAIIKRP
jgi:hypothetical protein